MTEALLQHLQERSNHRGLVVVRGRVLQQAMGVTFEELHHALVSLERDRQLRILSPLPYLTVALSRRLWRGAAQRSAKTTQETEADGVRDHSYSFHKQSIESKALAFEDGGVGEGELLLQEILATLGESDPNAFRAALAHYPVGRVRAVLARVRATPPEKLRKSRTALFRYLLARSK